MATAKLTMIDLQRFMLANGDDLFSLMTLPDGIDKDTLTGNILLRGGEFEVLYADPVFMRDMISIWARKWSRTFTKWVEALSIEYDPLENYDRREEWTDTRNRNDSSTEGTSASSNVSGNVNTTGTAEKKVSAYDSNTYQPSEQSTTSNNETSGSNTSSSGSLNRSGEEHEGAKHLGRIHGNIGVTTSQMMLESQLSISEWNLYEHITDLFLSEFIIPIYS